MNLVEIWVSTRLAISSSFMLQYTNLLIDLDELMYDDYDFEYEYTNDMNLDEDAYYAQNLDDDYARDGQDYQDLAYRHYAWYNLVNIHKILMPTVQKRHVRVTLDIMCYDDLDLEDFNWRRILELEGDEDVDVSIREYDPFK